MEREVAWKKYDEASLDELEALAVDYIDFISENKTERECAAAAIAAAEDAGYDSLADCIAAGTPVGPGSKLWACAQGKAVILVHVGAAPLSEGLNILGAHIDSPRLDIKQNPLYEANDFALLDTHYYGGIKNYQWTALPLALHGVVATTDGEVVEVNIGDDPADPVFCVTDLLPHLIRRARRSWKARTWTCSWATGRSPRPTPTRRTRQATPRKPRAPTPPRTR